MPQRTDQASTPPYFQPHGDGTRTTKPDCSSHASPRPGSLFCDVLQQPAPHSPPIRTTHSETISSASHEATPQHIHAPSSCPAQQPPRGSTPSCSAHDAQHNAAAPPQPESDSPHIHTLVWAASAYQPPPRTNSDPRGFFGLRRDNSLMVSRPVGTSDLVEETHGVDKDTMGEPIKKKPLRSTFARPNGHVLVKGKYTHKRSRLLCQPPAQKKEPPRHKTRAACLFTSSSNSTAYKRHKPLFPPE